MKISRPAQHIGDGALLLTGQVMHERLRPTRNRFVYPVFCVRVNLDRLAGLSRWWFGVNRWRLLSLFVRDYGPRDGSDLATWMRAQLAEAGLPNDGPIWLQTFPRLFGYAFNPVSFWYCHDSAGQLRALLAEVNNTFGERHRYLLAAGDAAPIGPGTTLTCRKSFHVSPFCEVEGHYEFRLRESAGTAFTGIDYFDRDGLLLRTSVGGRKQPFSRAQVLSAVLRQPLLTFGVVARIHRQALRLWLRKVPFHTKPAPPAVAQTIHVTESSSEKHPL